MISGCRDRIGADAQGASEVVGGAERQDPERQPGLDQRWRGAVQRSIAAAHDHDIDGARPLPDGTAQIGRTSAAHLLDVHPAATKHVQCRLDRSPAITGLAVEQEQCTPHAGGGRACPPFRLSLPVTP